ncbi:Hypothetical protein FKW44_012679, partial [Caligus rogercresseyi]
QVQRFSSPKSSPPVATKRGAMAAGYEAPDEDWEALRARGRGSASNARAGPVAEEAQPCHAAVNSSRPRDSIWPWR